MDAPSLFITTAHGVRRERVHETRLRANCAMPVRPMSEIDGIGAVTAVRLSSSAPYGDDVAVIMPADTERSVGWHRRLREAHIRAFGAGSGWGEVNPHAGRWT